MTSDELQGRAKAFSLRVLKLCDALNNGGIGSRELARQLVRSGMSVSANYRAARRARSRKEFAAKLGVVVEEADEVDHWFDLIREGGYASEGLVQAIQLEAKELLAIFSRMAKTTRMNLGSNKRASGTEASSHITTSLPRHITT